MASRNGGALAGRQAELDDLRSNRVCSLKAAPRARVWRSHANRGTEEEFPERPVRFCHNRSTRCAVAGLLVQLQFRGPVVNHLSLSDVIQISSAVDLGHKIRKGCISISVPFSLLLRMDLTHNRISKLM